MEIEQIKTEILKIYPQWKNTSDSIAGDKDAELEESFVRDLIIKYCENKGYEVDGYPFQKQILGETDNDYDEDYFCYERNLKYIDVLATIHEDVMEILYFYGKTFWPDQMESKEAYKKQLLLDILYNRYEIEF
ncbi:hypothetical protein [Flavobacterium sp.]|uniref:hypothetical protein n=1 Tax=Flavobacterium sp. TaxID=239 RepID=UPI003753290C